jgi:anti-anti-sigma factor
LSSNNHYTATNEVNGLMLLVIAQDLPDMSVLRLAGRIVQGDGSTALLNAVMSRQRKQPIVLDLAEVDTVDAHGLGLLAFLYKWARDNGIDFKIANAKAHVRDVLALTKLDSVLEVCSLNDLETVEAAREERDPLEVLF